MMLIRTLKKRVFKPVLNVTIWHDTLQNYIFCILINFEWHRSKLLMFIVVFYPDEVEPWWEIKESELTPELTVLLSSSSSARWLTFFDRLLCPTDVLKESLRLMTSDLSTTLSFGPERGVPRVGPSLNAPTAGGGVLRVCRPSPLTACWQNTHIRQSFSWNRRMMWMSGWGLNSTSTSTASETATGTWGADSQTVSVFRSAWRPKCTRRVVKELHFILLFNKHNHLRITTDEAPGGWMQYKP